MASKPSPPPELVGRTLFGTYRIKDRLGEGAMGTVYLAEQHMTKQRLALKVLHPHAASSAEIVQRFHREARVISLLTHPNVVRIFIYGATPEGVSYLAMEYVDGKPLTSILNRGKIDEARIVHIAKQICGAIGEAHALGIMHRDLKPDNVLLTEFRGTRDFVKILDFGIAKVQDAARQLTQAGIVYGTPAYMPPEQAKGLEVDSRADIYSLGCMLYEMATGRVPFDQKSILKVLEAQAFTEPTPPSQVAVVSPALEAIILKAMAKDKEQRFQSAGEMMEALDAVGRGNGSAKAVWSAKITELAQTAEWFWPAVGGLIGLLAFTVVVLLGVLAAT